MSAKRLVAHYEQIADAPDAIAQLRRFVLDLAIRGKLLPQDPKDGLASELLKRIAVDIARLVEAGAIKNAKPLPEIDPDAAPFELPVGWDWVRLGRIGNIFNGTSINSAEKETKYAGAKGLPYIATKDVGYGLDPLDYENGIRIPIGEAKFKVAHRGAVLICAEGGSAGKKCGLTEKDICFGNKLFANELFGAIPPRFILYLYTAPIFKSLFDASMSGIIGGVSIAKFAELPVPLPPLKEQHRIVAKVDELMALCDLLEAARATRETVRDRLATSSFARLNAPDPETFQDDARFVLAAVPALTTRPDQIRRLRQTILNLAVRGKLVPQDPKDEPASELLTRIAQEKKGRVKEGTIKSNPLSPVRDSLVPFALPIGWEWSRPEDFSMKITDGEHFRPPTVDDGIFFLSAKDIREEGVSLENPLYVSDETASKARSRCDPEFGDLLIVSRGATCGRICKVNIKDVFCLLGSVILIKPSSFIDSGYLEVALKSPFIFSALVTASGATAQGAIYLRDLKKIALPLPPIGEQRRIVAKVNELMALCDQLEARLTDAAAIRSRLLAALLAQTLEPAEAMAA